jgi:hypothetical protein
MTPAMTRVQAGYSKFPYYYYLLKHVKRRLATDGFVVRNDRALAKQWGSRQIKSGATDTSI